MNSKFHIPKACHEDWDKMTKVEKNRFCAACKTKIYDLTNASDREIQKLYEENNGKLCGRLEANIPSTRFRLNNFIKYVAAASVVLWASTKTVVAKNLRSIQQDSTVKDTLHNNIFMKLKGTVLDTSKKKTPIGFATISLYDKDSLIQTTYGYEDGSFQFQVDTASLEHPDSIKLIIKYIGYEDHEQFFNLNLLAPDPDKWSTAYMTPTIYLKKDENFKPVIIGLIRRKSILDDYDTKTIRISQ